MTVRRVWGWGIWAVGQLNCALLGLFHTTPSPRFSQATRLTPPPAAAAPLTMAGQVAPEGKMKRGVLLGNSGGRWGSCPTLPHGELRLWPWPCSSSDLGEWGAAK